MFGLKNNNKQPNWATNSSIYSSKTGERVRGQKHEFSGGKLGCLSIQAVCICSPPPPPTRFLLVCSTIPLMGGGGREKRDRTSIHSLPEPTSKPSLVEVCLPSKTTEVASWASHGGQRKMCSGLLTWPSSGDPQRHQDWQYAKEGQEQLPFMSIAVRR